MKTASEQRDVKDVIKRRYQDRASEIAELIAENKTPDTLIEAVYRLAYRDGYLSPYPHQGSCPDCGSRMIENGHGYRCPVCREEWWRQP
jgi:tRNA(Ile2) C34 agmatinyltransferase TiaS